MGIGDVRSYVPGRQIGDGDHRDDGPGGASPISQQIGDGDGEHFRSPAIGDGTPTGIPIPDSN
jgi:hypothetical protein